VATLTWSDIHWKEGKLGVSAKLALGFSPKSYAERSVPVTMSLIAALAARTAVGIWCEQDSLTPNGKRLPIHEERREAAGKYDGTGWHTFRHTYRSWLDDTGAPMGVQQKLMRHAQISTTMNVYGNALMTAKREANSKVVRMALRSA
jgi:integrase